jgi:hypothetical protein
LPFKFNNDKKQVEEVNEVVSEHKKKSSIHKSSAEQQASETRKQEQISNLFMNCATDSF